jgi:predicted RNA-binding protein with PIN domain
LTDALGTAAGLLESVDPPTAKANAPAPGSVPGAAAPVDPARVVAQRRRPLRMPPGMFEDSTEAAEHLVRVPGVLLLVDGYNVSKQGWPDLDLPLQRERLVGGLVTLQARTGARIEVVFDGVDDASWRGRTAPGRLRVEFTPTGVEADDRILDRLAGTPAHHPVVVVSNDHRIRDGARGRGANVLRAEQLLAALR